MANPSSMLRETTTDHIPAEVGRPGPPDWGRDAAAATQRGVDFDDRLGDVGNWRARAANLANLERPALRAAEQARILVVGEEPGTYACPAGVAWDDRSGQRLRAWMGVDKAFFYDQSRVAIITQGYCYPGRGAGPETPRRREGAALWLAQLLQRLPRLELTLLVGEKAQQQFLSSRRKPSLAQTARAWREYAPHYIALPHPSPRNQSWFKRHPWFDRQVVPMLRERIVALSAP